MDLYEMLNKRYPSQPAMQQSARTYIVRKLLKESKSPKTGSYYWFPFPYNNAKGYGWDIIEFFDDHYGDTQHDRRWPEVLNMLAIKWGKDPSALKMKLRNHYTGLPRGRVEQNPYGQFVLTHGNDSPGGNISAVLDSFNLKALEDTKRLIINAENEHEVMDVDDVNKLQKTIGKNFGLVGVSPPTFDFNDDE